MIYQNKEKKTKLHHTLKTEEDGFTYSVCNPAMVPREDGMAPYRLFSLKLLQKLKNKKTCYMIGDIAAFTRVKERIHRRVHPSKIE